MANPNLANLSNMFAEIEQYTPTTTESSATANASASGEVYQIDSIRVANITGSGGSNESITVKHRTNVSGTPTVVHIADEMVVSNSSALEVLATSMYLKEDQDIRLVASTNSTLEVLISYTRLS